VEGAFGPAQRRVFFSKFSAGEAIVFKITSLRLSNHPGTPSSLYYFVLFTPFFLSQYSIVLMPGRSSTTILVSILFLRPHFDPFFPFSSPPEDRPYDTRRSIPPFCTPLRKAAIEGSLFLVVVFLADLEESSNSLDGRCVLLRASDLFFLKTPLPPWVGDSIDPIKPFNTL